MISASSLGRPQTGAMGSGSDVESGHAWIWAGIGCLQSGGHAPSILHVEHRDFPWLTGIENISRRKSVPDHRPTPNDRQKYTCGMTILAAMCLFLSVQTVLSEDDPRTALVVAGQSLVNSAPDSDVSRARAQGWLDHLAGIEEENLGPGVTAQATPDGRLAYLEGWTSAEAGLNRSPDLDERAMVVLADAFPNDEVARVHAWTKMMSDPTVTWVAPNAPSDLTQRPFWNSSDTPADRIAATGSSANIVQMLKGSSDATYPAVVAATIAHGADQRHPDVRTVMVESMPQDPLRQAAIAFELARRRSPEHLTRFLREHPNILRIPGVYARTMSALALDDPETALEIGRGRETMQRLPTRGPMSVMGSLAYGLAASDPEAAIEDLASSGQADTRLIWILALADAIPPDKLDPPLGRGPLTDVKSFKTIRANMIVPTLATGIIDRDAAAAVFAHLARNGRWDPIGSFIRPNTTQPERAADSWLPYRLDILSRAFALAELPPETWSSLFSELGRLRSIDGQMAGLHGVARGYLSLHGDRPMPDVVKMALEKASIDMAVSD